MKKIIVLFSLIGFNLFCFSQQLEIDRLYEKYKNSETIVLYTTQGDITANVYIEMNDDNKPKSITISGYANSIAAIKELIGNMIAKKKNLGFTGPCETFVISSEFEIKHMSSSCELPYKCFKKCALKKGSQYFNCEYGGQHCKVESARQYNNDAAALNRAFGSNYPPISEYYMELSFSMETGDMKRAGGKKAKDLDF